MSNSNSIGREPSTGMRHRSQQFFAGAVDKRYVFQAYRKVLLPAGSPHFVPMGYEFRNRRPHETTLHGPSQARRSFGNRYPQHFRLSFFTRAERKPNHVLDTVALGGPFRICTSDPPQLKET
jgi:hypothetical protein